MYSLFPEKNVFRVQKFFSKEMYFLLPQRKMNSKIEYIQGIKVFLKRKCIPQNRMFSEYKAFPESKCIRVQEFSSKDMYSEYRKFPQKRMYSEYKSFPWKKMHQGKRVFLKRECIRSTRVFLERKCIHRRGHGFVTESEDGASSPPDEKKLSTCG